MSTPDPPVGVPAPGEVIADKYRVDSVLGAGGMGVVVAATHLQLEERVAIKILLPSLMKDAEIVERFLREGRAAVRIRSEHVGRVLDVGNVSPGGAPCIVMEYLEGQDLSHALEARGKLPPREAVEYVLQATEAIAEAHRAGIIHRDLKPANLFLTHRADCSPCIKVLDFGIAKLARSGDRANVTKTRMQMGSPLYMAPEQLRSSRQVDVRTDIWALGAVLHELIAGGPPFDADTLAELAILVATELPRRLPSGDPELAALQAVVDRCLEKDPDKRFPTVAEFADALAAVVDSEAARASARRIRRVLDPSASSSTAAASGSSSALSETVLEPPRASVTARSWSRTSSASPRIRLGLLAGAGAVVVIGGAIAWRAMPRANANAHAAASSSSAPTVTAAPTAPSSSAPPPPAAVLPPAPASAPRAEAKQIPSALARSPSPIRKPAASTIPAASQRPHVEDLH